MYYELAAIERLLSTVPRALYRAHQARAWLHDTVRTGVELHHVLVNYPEVRYEPLDAHYLLLQGVSALDSELMSDLASLAPTSDASVVLAALLVCLEPLAPAQALLARSPELDSPAARWWLGRVRAARGLTGAEADAADHHLAVLSTQLSACQRTRVKLPRALELSVALERQAAVRAAYRAAGADAALQELERWRELQGERRT